MRSVLKAIVLLLIGSLMISSSHAAVGDILAASVDTNGWQMRIWISNLSTGGTYNLGISTNNNNLPDAAKIVLNVVSRGFDDSGVPTTINRTVWGTIHARQAYPNNLLADESFDGANVAVKVNLSDFIYPDDVITASFASGFYTQNSTLNNARSSLAVTNTSTMPYPHVIGNWSWVGLDRITNSTFALRCVAFQRFGQQGRPVRVVRFQAADQHGHTNTVFQLAPSIDTSIGDAVPVIEYIGQMNAQSFTQGDVITCNFRAYPWLGDSGSCLDTADGVNAAPTPHWCPQQFVCDTGRTYGATVAVVDPNAGNDSSGATINESSFNPNSPPAAFRTINGAAAAIASLNLANYSRNDVGAATIYLKAGAHSWTGGTSSYGVAQKTWLTITAFPGVARSSVSIHHQSGAAHIGDRVKFVNVLVDTPDVFTFDGMNYLWFDQCEINSTNSNNNWINDVRIVYTTRSKLSSWGSVSGSGSSVMPAANMNMSPALVRGNNLGANIRKVATYTVLGNSYDDVNTSLLTFKAEDFTSNVPQPTNAIFAFNRIYRYNNSGSVPLVGMYNTTEHNEWGAAIVQNLLESMSPGQATLWTAGDGHITNCFNLIIWQNTIVGGRHNCAYNDTAPGPYMKINWSLKQNIMFKHAIKDDVTFNVPTLTGNWSIVNGVGSVGNIYPEVQGVNAAGSFLHEFVGISSYQTHGMVPPGNFLQFKNPQCFDGSSASTNNPGGGDYHLLTNSPAYNLGRELLLPYDLDGHSRVANDPPGAYTVLQRPSPPNILRFNP